MTIDRSPSGAPPPEERKTPEFPPELFENILFFVGDAERLCVVREDPMMRQEEMKFLSTCALINTYWARSARKRMFEKVVLRSAKDISGLRSLLRASPSDRIDPIGALLRQLNIFYKLGDIPWFHNVSGLVASGADRLDCVIFSVLGPVPPAFTVGNTRRSIAHPLFYASPRVMPMTPFHNFTVYVDISDIHFTHPSMLYSLLQDCKLLRPRSIICGKLTWDQDPTATPSSFGWILAHHSRLEFVWPSKCTDNALAGIMALSAPPHESSRRPHLNTTDFSSLLDIIRTSCGPAASPEFRIEPISGFGHTSRGLDWEIEPTWIRGPNRPGLGDRTDLDWGTEPTFRSECALRGLDLHEGGEFGTEPIFGFGCASRGLDLYEGGDSGEWGTEPSPTSGFGRASRGLAASGIRIEPISGFDNVQERSAARLTKDCDLAFHWWNMDVISFSCITSRRSGDDINIRYATHIIIEPSYGDLTKFRENIKTIDWDAFLHSVKTFPDLRGIIFQCRYGYDEEEWHKCLVELVPLLREAWVDVDNVLQSFYVPQYPRITDIVEVFMTLGLY